MLESLLSTGSAKGYYPNSGPGIKHLFSGDENFGYFGVVTDAEMAGAGDTLVDTLFAPTPTLAYVRYEAVNWVKVFYKRKVYFYPITPLAYGCSLHEVIKSGLMRGDDLPVSFTTSAGAVIYKSKPHNRRLFVSEGSKNWKLIPKLPTSTRTSATETAIEKNSEAGELLSGLFGYLPNQFLKEPGVVLCRMLSDEAYILIGDTYWDWTVSTNETQKALGAQTWRELRATPSNLSASYAATQYDTADTSANSLKYYYRPLLVLDQDQSTTTTVIYPVTQAKGQSDLVVQSQSSGSLESIDDVQELELELLTTTSDTAGTQNIELDSSTDPVDVVAAGIAQTEVTNSAQVNDSSPSSPARTISVTEDSDLLFTATQALTASSPATVINAVEGSVVAPTGLSVESTDELFAVSLFAISPFEPNFKVEKV